MEEINLLVQARKEIGKSKVKSLRTKGVIPGVVYGEGKKSQPISVDKKTFLRILKSQKGENVIINLSIAADEKKSKEIPVLIKEMQHDPVSDELVHIDFNQISLTKEIRVKVPILAKGEPTGVKQDGGSLAHLLWDLEVECLPTEIPANIEVDVSNLKIGDAIHIKDLIVSKKVKVLHDADLVVLSVAPPVKEVLPEEAAVEGASAEPEVLKEKKEVPGEEGKEEKAEKKEEAPKKAEKAEK